jgi:hypothetical protein
MESTPTDTTDEKEKIENFCENGKRLIPVHIFEIQKHAIENWSTLMRCLQNTDCKEKYPKKEGNGQNTLYNASNDAHEEKEKKQSLVYDDDFKKLIDKLCDSHEEESEDQREADHDEEEKERGNEKEEKEEMKIKKIQFSYLEPTEDFEDFAISDEDEGMA